MANLIRRTSAKRLIDGFWSLLQGRLPAGRATAWAAMALVLAAAAGCASVAQTRQKQVSDLTQAIRDKDMSSAVDLMSRHPEVLDEKRALQVAIKVGDSAAVAFFAKRAGVNTELDLDDTTPLIKTITGAPPAARKQITETLLAMGADPTRTDKYGDSAGSLAERRGEWDLLDAMEKAGYGPAKSAPMLAWLPSSLQLAPSPGVRLGAASAPVATPSTHPAPKARGRRSAPQPREAAPIPVRSNAATFLLRSAWLPRLAPGQSGEVAGLRFHVDGTGDLLKHEAGTRRTTIVPGAYVAWDYNRQRLRLFVLAPDFSALCESSDVFENRVDMNCTDYSYLTVGSNRRFGQGDAQVFLERPMAIRASLKTTANTSIQPARSEEACRPRNVRTTVSRLRAGESGDFYVFDPRKFEAYSPMTGMACTQITAQRTAELACKRAGSTNCVGIGGCASGQISAVAAVGTHAFVGCDNDLELARSKALERCRETAGCDCQLIALGGDNINTLRQPACVR